MKRKVWMTIAVLYIGAGSVTSNAESAGTPSAILIWDMKKKYSKQKYTKDREELWSYCYEIADRVGIDDKMSVCTWVVHYLQIQQYTRL